MTKYYVKSGTFRRVIEADTDRNAAISAVQMAVEQVLPMNNINSSETDSKTPIEANQFVMLSGKVVISESGFDSEKVIELSTKEVVSAWNQFMNTLDQLEKMLDSAVWVLSVTFRLAVAGTQRLFERIARGVNSIVFLK